MDRDNIEFLKKFLPFIIVFSVLGFFTILFIFFYSNNYSKTLDEQNKQNIEVINNTVTISNQPENFIVEEVNSIEISNNNLSVFEQDLPKKEKNHYKKSLINTGTEILSNDLITDYKYDIFSYLYLKNFESAKNTALEISSKYDFFDEQFRDFEILLYETINSFNNFENMSSIEKSNLISRLDSPELILFVFNTLSFNERRAVSQNKYSEIFDSSISSNIGLTVLKYGRDGLERAGAENVFFTTSDYHAYSIKFSHFGKEYILYYLKNKKSNQTIIMGIDDLSGDITTLKDYDYLYN